MYNKIKIYSDILPSKDVELYFKIGENNQNNVIIYGRNGSGKSTLCREINNLKVEFDEYDFSSETSSVKLYNDEKLIDRQELNFDNIYVYNDDFQSKYVSFAETGSLDTIVMLGNQGEIQERIDKISETITELDKEQKEFEEKIELLNIDNRRKELESHLKGDNNWAGRQRLIWQNKNNTSLKPQHFNKIISQTPKESISELKSKISGYIKTIESYDKLKTLNFTAILNGVQYIYEQINEQKNVESIVDSIISKELKNKVTNIGNTIIETNNDSLLEERISVSLENFGLNYINNIKSMLSDDEKSFCPTCLRDIDNSYKEQLKEVISEIVEETKVSELENEIKNINIMKFKLIEENEYLSVSLIKEMNEYIDSYNTEIDILVSQLQKKLLMLNEKFDFNDNLQKIEKLLKRIVEIVVIITKEVNQLNIELKDKKKLERKATQTNYELAYLEIEDSYIDFKKVEATVMEFKENYKLTGVHKDELNSELITLNSKLKQTDIALKSINNNLAKIFYDKERLVLEQGIDEDRYFVKSRGHKVKLNDLSIGEQNIIGLCYFFSTINQDKKQVDQFKEELLIVIDDPISSFDRENKIGIYNFMRKMFKDINAANNSSKFIITTHDIDAFLNIEKIFREVPGNKTSKANTKILNYNGISNYGKKNSSQYSVNMNYIYEFANNNSNEVNQLSDVIGNIMRRILEGFSTFNFRVGIDEIRTDKAILENIQSDKERQFFESFMFRLVMHNESHLQDTVTNMSDGDFYKFLSIEEKQYTAKMLLVFLYRLNDIHVKKYINDSENNIVNNIDEWAKLINN